MLKKRLIGVVTVKNGLAVQSFGYSRWLPIGSPECVIENLDRWGADEIVVLAIDRSIHGWGPDLDLIRRLGTLGLRTPIAYGGGISTANDGVEVVKAGADRVIVDNILTRDPKVAHWLADRLGAQAVIAALPVSLSAGKLLWLDHVKRSEFSISKNALSVISARYISELMVIDWRNEGSQGTFEARLLDALPSSIAQVPRIAFGGIGLTTQSQALLRREDVCAVALGNLLNYREHALQAWREKMPGEVVRPTVYDRVK